MTDKKLPRRVFLAELDALLDTRSAILNRELKSDVIPILKNGYIYRNVDHFPGLEFKKFRELYAQRDKTLLVDSMATKIVSMISEYVQSVISNVFATPFHYEPVVMINIHPYKLTDAEISVIADTFSKRIGSLADIEIINQPYEKLTPRFLNENEVAYFAVYDYTNYINTHMVTNAFTSCPAPTTALVIPRIIVSEPSNQLNPNLEYIFQTVEDNISPYIGINYLPVGDFCLDLPEELLSSLVTTA